RTGTTCRPRARPRPRARRTGRRAARAAPRRSSARAAGAPGSPGAARRAAPGSGSRSRACRGGGVLRTCTLTSFRVTRSNSYFMITNEQVAELRASLRRVMRGLWARRRPTPELLALTGGDPPLGRRHVAVLAHVGAEGERSVGQLAHELGLSLPAASKLTRDLEEHRLLRRREDPADRRRTVVGLEPATTGQVEAWLEGRRRPLERPLEVLDGDEREAFLKGLRALADALVEESPGGPLRPNYRAAHRRRAHRDRPV